MFIEPGKIQTSSYQERDNSKVSECAKAPGFSLGRLDQRIESFKQAVINARLFPLHDTLPVSLDRTGGFDHGRNAAMRRPEVPFPKHGFKQLSGWCLIDLLKVFPNVQGLNGFQIQLRHG